MSVCHFEKKMGVIRRMEDGQTRFNVCKSVELLQWAVSSNITSVEKVKQRMGHAATGSATAVSYSRSKYFQKKKLRNYFHCGWMTEIKKKKLIPLTQAVFTPQSKMINAGGVRVTVTKTFVRYGLRKYKRTIFIFLSLNIV